MRFSRRNFLQQASAFGVAWSAGHAFAQQMNHGQMPMPGKPAGQAAKPPANADLPMMHTLALPSFVDALPFPETLRGIRDPKTSLTKMRLAMREVRFKVHRDMQPTRMWTYGTGTSASGALAPLIDVRSHQTLQVEWVNELPAQHFLPIDYSLHGSGHDVPDVRAVAHLHGARAPSKDDGYPEDWFVPGKSRICTYPMEQAAAALWYHDHAMSINRLNIYAGMFGAMLIRDNDEDALDLPSGKYEIPLILYDRNFTTDSQLFYGTSGIHDRPWVPEFPGDAILINGKLTPYFEVEPRLYRFRLFNTANSSFFRLSVGLPGSTPTKPHLMPVHQIGSDQGLLASPVEMTYLSLAPAERIDLLVDFSGVAGETVHLRHAADNILQFRVAKSAVQSSAKGKTTFVQVPKTLRAIERIPESSAITTRTITLHEYMDLQGRSMLMLLNRKHWHEPVTETPRLNTTEIWEFVNLTEDTHPMHLHLVRFQILDRREFDVFAFQNKKGTHYTGPAIPPDPHELGWKDVVQCPAGMITRIIVRFEGYTGKYLYHCHILEHEANDMMRPFEVIA
ncbi:MAG TPA: multicopper oxidase domain-containing protein [Acidobacteriaceae bacterium]